MLNWAEPTDLRQLVALESEKERKIVAQRGGRNGKESLKILWETREWQGHKLNVTRNCSFPWTSDYKKI